MSTDKITAQQRALDLVAEAGAALEEARTLLLTRSSVAVAAGLDLKTVARAAGLDPATLRRWIVGRDQDHHKAHRGQDAVPRPQH